MGSTARFGLRYPDLTDAPNGPDQFEALAEDADGWLCRAYRCTSATRPSGVPNDFLIRESDTGNVLIWTGSSWAQIAGAVSSGGGGGGGGGGGTSTGAIGTVSATYAATAAQAIPAGSDVVVAFAVAQTTDSSVTRNTSGAGHSFTLNQTRLWTISTTLRFAQDGVGGRTFELRAGTAVLTKAGGDAPVNTPYTQNMSVTRTLPSGTVITAIARHNSTNSLALDPNAGNYVHIDLAGV